MSNLGPPRVLHTCARTYMNTDVCIHTHEAGGGGGEQTKTHCLVGFPIILLLTAASTANVSAVSLADEHLIRVRQALLPCGT